MSKNKVLFLQILAIITAIILIYIMSDDFDIKNEINIVIDENTKPLPNKYPLYSYINDMQNKGNSNIKNIQNVIYLFWTGGYDSTFRLCQLVLNDIPVQPIYIIDPKSDGTMFERRKNRKFEIEAMNEIKKKLKQLRPNAIILPTWYIKKVKISKEVYDRMYQLYKLGAVSRPISQYAAMAETSLKLGIPIESGSEKGDHTILSKAVRQYIEVIKVEMKTTSNDMIIMHNHRLGDCPEYLKIFRNIRFPIINYTKEDMLAEAEKNNFKDVLTESFSCWYPDKFGIACGVCNMCKERII